MKNLELAYKMSQISSSNLTMGVRQVLPGTKNRINTSSTTLKQIFVSDLFLSNSQIGIYHTNFLLC